MPNEGKFSEDWNELTMPVYIPKSSTVKDLQDKILRVFPKYLTNNVINYETVSMINLWKVNSGSLEES